MEEKVGIWRAKAHVTLSTSPDRKRREVTTETEQLGRQSLEADWMGLGRAGDHGEGDRSSWDQGGGWPRTG